MLPGLMQVDIRDDLQPIPLPPSAGIPVLAIAICCVIALAAIACVILRFRMRVRRAVTWRSPEEMARDRLSALQTSDRRAFYAELTAALSEYLDARFELHTRRGTSAEWIDAVSNSAMATPQAVEDLRQLLAECDRVKFGPDAENDPVAARARCRDLIGQLAASAASAPRFTTPITRIPRGHAAI